jgi:hypothetical protein
MRIRAVSILEQALLTRPSFSEDGCLRLVLMLMISTDNRIHVQGTSRRRLVNLPRRSFQRPSSAAACYGGWKGRSPHTPFGLEPFDKLRVSSKAEQLRAERPTVLSLSKGSCPPLRWDLRHAGRTTCGFKKDRSYLGACEPQC